MFFARVNLGHWVIGSMPIIVFWGPFRALSYGVYVGCFFLMSMQVIVSSGHCRLWANAAQGQFIVLSALWFTSSSVDKSMRCRNQINITWLLKLRYCIFIWSKATLR